MYILSIQTIYNVFIIVCTYICEYFGTALVHMYVRMHVHVLQVSPAPKPQTPKPQQAPPKFTSPTPQVSATITTRKKPAVPALQQHRTEPNPEKAVCVNHTYTHTYSVYVPVMYPTFIQRYQTEVILPQPAKLILQLVRFMLPHLK